MLKIGVTAVVTALLCFAIATATGFGAATATPTVINMKVNQIIYLKSDNFHCQALTAKQVACGANSLPNSVQVYFGPHTILVVKFDKTGKKYKVVANINR